MQIGIYPGSFDPLTCGHLDIIKRATQLFDRLVVAIARNSEKFPLFSVEERLAMLSECCRDISKVELTSFDGLLAEYCKKNNINFIVRGLRAIVDFEYEYAIALMNKEIAPSVETIFLMSKSEFSFVSSKMVKEVAGYGGDISRLVPEFVNKKLKEKFQS